MRKLVCLLVGIAGMALTAGAHAADVPKAPPRSIVVAPPPISGYTSLYLGQTWWNNHGGTDCEDGCPQPRTGNNFLFGGDSRVNWFLSPGMSLQVDVQGEATTRYVGAHPAPEDPNADGRLWGMFGTHLSSRNAAHLWGGFGALSYANNLGGEGSPVA